MEKSDSSVLTFFLQLQFSYSLFAYGACSTSLALPVCARCMHESMRGQLGWFQIEIYALLKGSNIRRYLISLFLKSLIYKVLVLILLFEQNSVFETF